jgi:DNA-binding NarL/FixJ family response regulator
MPTTLVIVDDHDVFRGFARTMLAAEGFDVTGEAQDGASAVAAVQSLHPDAVLLDIQLPDMDGFEVARRLRAIDGGPSIVLTSTREAADYGARITDSAVRGFIPKQDLSGAGLAALLAAA